MLQKYKIKRSQSLIWVARSPASGLPNSFEQNNALQVILIFFDMPELQLLLTQITPVET